MSWSRRWRIDSREKWLRILAALAEFDIDFARRPIEIVVREEFEEKTARQRNLFHAVCDDVGVQLGYFPGEFKKVVKAVYFGDDWRFFSTEELDYEHYGHLIECAYMIAAYEGIVIPDRRAR